MAVGRDAQRIRYQPMGSSPPETITHLEDKWGAKVQGIGTGRSECYSSRGRKKFRCNAGHQVPGGLAGEEHACCLYEGFACMCVCALYACVVPRGQKSAIPGNVVTDSYEPPCEPGIS